VTAEELVKDFQRIASEEKFAGFEKVSFRNL
jgi:hypothetical protein